MPTTSDLATAAQQLLEAAVTGETELVQQLLESAKAAAGAAADTSAAGFTVSELFAAATAATAAPRAARLPGVFTSALHTAARAGHVSIVRLLLASGHDANIPTASTGLTALHIAAYNRSAEMLQLLLQAGADPNARTKSAGQQHSNTDWTPLHCAARRGCSRAVKALLAAGADMEAQCRTGPDSTATPLQLANKGVHLAAIAALLSAGAHTTWLHEAAELGNEAAVKWLLQASARVDALDHDGGTPLDMAAACHNYAIVAMLLAAGANVHAQRLRGYHPGDTPLHSAVRFGYWLSPAPQFKNVWSGWRIVRMLLAAGADVDAVNKQQQTPLHVAASYGRRAMLYPLLEAGAAVNIVCGDAGTPLHAAVVGSHFMGQFAGSGCDLAVRALLGAGADPGARGTLVWPPGQFTCARWQGTPLDRAAEIAVGAAYRDNWGALDTVLLYLESEPAEVCVKLLVNAAVRAAAAAAREQRELERLPDLLNKFELSAREVAHKLLTAAVARDVSRAQAALQRQLYCSCSPSSSSSSSSSSSGGLRARCGSRVLKLLTQVWVDMWLAAAAKDTAAEHRAVQTMLVNVSRVVQQDGQSDHAIDAA